MYVSTVTMVTDLQLLIFSLLIIFSVGTFHRKILLQFEVSEFEKKHHEKLRGVLDRISFVRSLQVC